VSFFRHPPPSTLFPYTTLFRSRTRDFMTDLNGYLAEREFVAGDQFSAADITALVTIDFAKWIKIEIPDDHSHLKRWYEAVSSRRSEEHTSELQSRENVVCRLLL